jgi:hydroxymethylpyrimidine pyrophosphatase-like HAD family hydrolase
VPTLGGGLDEIMKTRLIALDIDGTILDKPTGLDVPEEVSDAVEEARAGGARVCLCSSRPCFFMGDATDGLTGVDALIGCSGAEVQVARFDPETTEKAGLSASDSCAADYKVAGAVVPAHRGFEPLYNDKLSLPLAYVCIDFARKWNVYTSFGGKEKILARLVGPLSPELAADPLFAFMKEDELISLLKEQPVSCAFIFMEEDIPEEAISSLLELKDATVHRSSESSLIITNKGTDKGTGVLRLAELWNIPREAILAVGNDENDIPMLEAAGVGVAVANASPETLAAADWIAPDVWNAGAAAAIRRFAL